MTFVDEVAARLTGWEAGELVGRRMYDTVHHHTLDGSSYASHECPIYEALEDGNTHRGADEMFWRRDDTILPVEYGSTPIHEGNEVVGVVVIFEDISERGRVEEEFRRKEARNRTVLEAIPDVILRLSRDGEYLNVLSKDVGKLYLPTEDLLGRSVRDVLPPPVATCLFRKTATTLDTGEMQEFEYTLDVPDGTLTFEARLVVSGPDEVLCLARNVTERRSIEEELRGSTRGSRPTSGTRHGLLLPHLRQALPGRLPQDRPLLRRRLGKDDNDTVLVSGMVGQAHALGLKVTAEGVETNDQLARFGKIGCDLDHGYLISRPSRWTRPRTFSGVR